MHRNDQLEKLAQLVRDQKKPVLLVGDLNVSPWSSYFTRLLKNSGLKNSMKGFGFQPSWPSNTSFLRIPIDHVLYTPEIVIRNRAVGPDVGSDHLPVIVDFALN
jgi:endonuclease/exonuclease/phosphatase (EEP) superfamily protein YafD